MEGENMRTEDMCNVDENVIPDLKALNRRKGLDRVAVFVKIDVNKNLIHIEDTYEKCTNEELQEELPDTQPRFVIYRYVHQTRDGRTTFPFFMIYYLPSGCHPQQAMRYAGSKDKILELSGTKRYVEMTNKEDLTDEWLVKRLSLK